MHIAEFVQNGILNEYVSILFADLGQMTNIDIEKEIKDKIEDLLVNIEKHSYFVLGNTAIKELIKKSNTVVSSHSPDIFAVAGVKSAAIIVKESINLLSKMLKEYDLKRISTGEKEILFFKRKLIKGT